MERSSPNTSASKSAFSVCSFNCIGCVMQDEENPLGEKKEKNDNFGGKTESF